MRWVTVPRATPSLRASVATLARASLRSRAIRARSVESMAACSFGRPDGAREAFGHSPHGLAGYTGMRARGRAATGVCCTFCSISYAILPVFWRNGGRIDDIHCHPLGPHWAHHIGYQGDTPCTPMLRCGHAPCFWIPTMWPG